MYSLRRMAASHSGIRNPNPPHAINNQQFACPRVWSLDSTPPFPRYVPPPPPEPLKFTTLLCNPRASITNSVLLKIHSSHPPKRPQSTANISHNTTTFSALCHRAAYEWRSFRAQIPSSTRVSGPFICGLSDKNLNMMMDSQRPLPKLIGSSSHYHHSILNARASAST